MDRRGFLKSNISGSFFLGLAAGAAATAAGGIGVYRRMQDKRVGFTSYAQQGEDVVLWQILRDALRIENITYLDIGANEPIHNNNTFFFYERGMRGVLVEPNPALWDWLAGVRPRDALLRAGIGAGGRSEANYYVIDGVVSTGPLQSGPLNTFDKAQADDYIRKGEGRLRIREVLRMPLLDINEIMAEHFGGAPNLLSVDTEGFELPILRSLDFKRYRPDVVCVDTLVFGTRRIKTETLKFMASKGYDVRGGSFVNTIFVDRRHTA